MRKMPTRMDLPIAPRRAPRWMGPLVLVAWWLLVACSGAGTPAPLPTAAAPTPFQPDTAPPLPERAPLPEDSVNEELVLWVPDFYNLNPAQTGGQTLYTARVLFEQTYPGVFLDVVNRAETGQASLLAFLRIAHRVAPGILPDAVILNTQDLWQAVDAGLIQPLHPAALAEIEDFYPFALAAATYNDTLYGVPVSADLQHLVYHRDASLGRGAETAPAPPLNWSQVISQGVPFLFAAGVREPARNLSLLLQYVGAGGALDEEGLLTQPVSFFDFLVFLEESRWLGVIPDQAVGLLSEEAVWQAFVANRPALAAVNSRYYLSQREIWDEVGFAPVPTQDGIPTTVAQTWALALLTPDPDRQALILEFAQELLQPEVLGPWNQFSYRLPTRRGAFQSWTSPHPYYAFLDGQLQGAAALPNGRAFADLAQRLQQAAQDVLAGHLEPEEALLNAQAMP